MVEVNILWRVHNQCDIALKPRTCYSAGSEVLIMFPFLSHAIQAAVRGTRDRRLTMHIIKACIRRDAPDAKQLNPGF